jgi:polysaccharide export outer membrane protein
LGLSQRKLCPDFNLQATASKGESIMKIALAVLLPAAFLLAQERPQNLPVQRIGANDLLGISVYDAPELTRTVRVDGGGAIALPLVKRRIQAAGLYPRELEDAIARSLREEQILVDPEVKVTIAEYFSRPISVAGAVRKPVTFQAAAPLRLLEALARAEGLTELAGAEILVTRADGAGAERIPVSGLISEADPKYNVTLSGGEEVRVPEADKVYVVGNVKKPGAFAVRDNTPPTVLKLLALAEGLAPFPGRQAFIYRRDGPGGTKTEIPVELEKIMKRKAADVSLQPNDILYVPDNSGRRLGVAALDRIILFGSTAGATALVWRR